MRTQVARRPLTLIPNPNPNPLTLIVTLTPTLILILTLTLTLTLTRRRGGLGEGSAGPHAEQAGVAAGAQARLRRAVHVPARHAYQRTAAAAGLEQIRSRSNRKRRRLRVLLNRACLADVGLHAGRGHVLTICVRLRDVGCPTRRCSPEREIAQGWGSLSPSPTILAVQRRIRVYKQSRSYEYPLVRPCRSQP